MDVAQFVTVLSQLALGAAAYRLASQLKLRVDNHETRIVKLETAEAR